MYALTSPRKAACLRGETTYYGTPCKLCGGTFRYTSCKNCVDCALAKSKRQYARSRAKITDDFVSNSTKPES